MVRFVGGGAVGYPSLYSSSSSLSVAEYFTRPLYSWMSPSNDSRLSPSGTTRPVSIISCRKFCSLQYCSLDSFVNMFSGERRLKPSTDAVVSGAFLAFGIFFSNLTTMVVFLLVCCHVCILAHLMAYVKNYFLYCAGGGVCLTIVPKSPAEVASLSVPRVASPPFSPDEGEDRPSQPTIQQSASQRPAPAGLSHGCLRHPPTSLASLGHPNAPSTRSARLRPLPASAPSGTLTSTLTSNLGLGLGQCLVQGIEMAGLARLSDQLTVLYSERSASTPVKPVLFSELSCIMARRGSPTDLRIKCRYDWAAMVIMAQQSMRSSWHVLLPTT